MSCLHSLRGILGLRNDPVVPVFQNRSKSVSELNILALARQHRKEEKKKWWKPLLLCISKNIMCASPRLSVQEQTLGIPLDLMAAVIDLLPVVLCIIDSTGNLLHCNPTFSANMNFLQQRVLAKPCSIAEAISSEDRERFFHLLEHMNENGETSNGDYLTRMLNNGEPNEVIYNWTLVPNANTDYFIMCGKPVQDKKLYDQILAKRYEDYSENIITSRFRESNMMFSSSYTANTTGSLTSNLSMGGISRDEHAAKYPWEVFVERLQTKTKKFLELKEAQLKLDAMEQTLETKRVFVRYVSHEIRTPLNVVMSGLYLLKTLHQQHQAQLPSLQQQTHAEDEDCADILRDVTAATSTAIDILNDLLTYEKLDSNILTLERIPCDIVDICERVCNMFHIQARNSEIGLNLHNNIAAEGIIVDGDPSKLAQVFRNLVSNAIKFTPPGGSVDLYLNIVEETNCVRLEVHDTGPGMTKEERKKLFHEIVQFNAQALQSGGGSGLGLYLTRKIVDMHEGAIGVDLHWEGAGSRFYVELPISSRLRTVTDTVTDARASVSGMTAISSDEVRTLSLLIVDDSVLIRKFYNRMFKSFVKFEVEVTEASNGDIAVQKVKEAIDRDAVFDGIVMDANMPVLNGLDATQQIRDLGYTGKIFGVTGNAFQADIDEFASKGADEVYVKPLSVEKYTRILKISAGSYVIIKSEINLTQSSRLDHTISTRISI